MRKIRTTIEIEFDESLMIEDASDPENRMSDEDLLLHAATCFTEDIEQMVKYNELFQLALERTTFVQVEELQQCGPGQELIILDGAPEEGHQPGN